MSRQNNKVKIFSVLAIILAFLVFPSFFQRPTAGIFVPVLTPLFNLNSYIGDKMENITLLIKDKKNLEKKNEELKKIKENLEEKFFSWNLLRQENEELKAILLRIKNNKEKNNILASIISRPPISPYDILLIDVGSEDGLKEGMNVFAGEDIFVGKVAEVFLKNSKVKMVSYPEEKIEAILHLNDSQAQISVMTKGKGGGSMEIDLSDSIEVKTGDLITTPGVFLFILGMVEKIEREESESVQKIIFRSPLNIQELEYVTIKYSND